ncbi:MAG: hypothetical protein J6V08_04630, partial [Candidatus Methanomethylophilaceae archaeon]|nr:hypothetical protein [Candidatus Methanomethylophilaceae archaeon]
KFFEDFPELRDYECASQSYEAEVEPVTRCRDCRFYTEEDRWCRRLGLCGAFDPNDYCSHAEEGEEC